MKKILITIIVVMILAILGGLYYWYFHIQNPTKPITKTTAPAETPAFSPFGSTEIPTPTATSTASVKEDTATEDTDTSYKQPKLRQMSTTPVAGFVASTSAVRYIERGTGHVYEALLTSEKVNKISNTTLPKIYEAYGNKSGTNFIVQYLKDESDIITNFYAELRATGTSTTETPFQLKGRYLSPDINQIAISPSGDRIFTWNIENGRGAGYISAFD
ncbi:MAG: hypothetical protein Q7S72_01220 [Candidatus Taylorbacteria bacterium]|nr:hypothetical protein [Candidatus Taylorbacteria bacterium]